MTNEDILDKLTKPKKKPKKPEIIPENRIRTSSGTMSVMTIEELNGRPLSGKGHPNYNKGKKYDGDRFAKGANAYLGVKGIDQIKAAKIAGMSTPTFVKYMNKLLTDGTLDGNIFTDGQPVTFDPNYDYGKTNDGILNKLMQ